MGRVTRAAARADPILADETCTVAEAALLEDPARIPLPPSPEKPSNRPPLGEIHGNDISTTATSSQASNLDLVDTSDSNSSVRSDETASSSKKENLVVLVLGEDGKTAASGKKSGKTTGTMKKSAKKAKGTITEPSTQVIEQLRQTLEENVKIFKERSYKEDTQGAGDKILDDDTAVTPSNASSEASDMLKEETMPATTANDDISAVAPSPAVRSARKKFAQADPTVPTSTKRDSAKMTPNRTKSFISTGSNPTPDGPNQSRAVQKLARLFQPQLQSLEKPLGRSTPKIMPQVYASQHAASNDPIEALDALEEDIEAVEKSIAVVKKIQSTHKPATAARSSKTVWPGKTVSGPLAKTAQAPGSTARRSLSQTISPTDRILGAKKRTVEALNTPEKSRKSTKPATKSSFQLSSEATAAKLKAQREERQKRREDDHKKKQDELKAKSAVMRTKAAEVKTTVASRARLSLAAEKGKMEDANKKTTTLTSAKRVSTANVAKASGDTSLTKTPIGPVAKPQERSVMTTATSQLHKAVASTTVTRAPRLSTLARSSRPINSPAAKDIVSRTVGRVARPSVTGVTAKRTSLQPESRVSTANSKLTSVSENPVKTTNKTKGKEVFNREKLEKAQLELEIQEKLEAAKKSRVEAAARGRAASKAWAEKKKQTADAAKSGSSSNSDKGGSVSGDTQAAASGDENKENNQQNVRDQPQADVEEPRESMALGILREDNIAQDDAAYIFAEMHRIHKKLQGTDILGDGCSL